MANDKEIRVKLVVDQRSAEQTKRVFADLMRMFKDVGKSMPGGPGGLLGGMNIFGGGGTGGQQQNNFKVYGTTAGSSSELEKSVRALTQHMKTIKKESTDVIRDTAKQSKDAINAELSSLDKLINKYEELNDVRQKGVYGATAPGGGSGSGPGGFSSFLAPGGGAIHSGGLLGPFAPGVGNHPPIIVPPKAGGGAPGGGGPGWFSRALGAGVTKGGMGVIGAMAISAVNQYAGELQKQPQDWLNANYQLGQTWGASAYKARNGDMSDWYAMDLALRDPAFRGDFYKLASDAGFANQIKAVTNGLSLRHLMDVNGSFRKFMFANVDAKNLFHSQIAKVKGTNDNLALFQDMARFDSSFGSDLHDMRRMGVGTKGLISYQNMFENMGVDAGAGTGMFSNIMSIGGRGLARSQIGNAIRAMRAGMNPGAAAALAGMGIGGSGDQAFGAIASLANSSDIEAAGKIGQYVATTMNNSGGFTSGLGLIGALSNGIGSGDRSMVNAQLNIQGAQQLGTLFGGSFDAYQQGINTVNASRIAGDKGFTTVDMLSRMSFEDAAAIMSGEVPPQFKALGLSLPQLQQYAKTVLNSMGNRYAKFDSNSAAGKAMSALNAAGGWANIRGFLKKHNDANTISGLTTALMAINQTDYGTASGMLNDLGGLGSTLGAGKFHDSGGGSVQMHKFQAVAHGNRAYRANIMGGIADSLKHVNEKVSPYQTFQDQIEAAFSNIGQMYTASEQVSDSFERLKITVDALNDSMGKGLTPQQKAKAAQALMKARAEARHAKAYKMAVAKYDQDALQDYVQGQSDFADKVVNGYTSDFEDKLKRQGE